MHTKKKKKKSSRNTRSNRHDGPITGRPSPPAPIDALQNDLQKALAYHEAGQIEQAEKIYLAILAMTPDHAEALHLLGEIAIRRGQHEAAADLISRAIQSNPNNEHYFHNLGIAYQRQKRLTEAASCYEQAIRLNPAMTMSLNNLGRVMQALGRYDEAVSSYQKALTQDPSYLAALNNLGLLYDRANRLDDAIACFKKMLRINPQVAEALNNLGLTLQKQGKPTEAVIAFEQAIHITPDFAFAYNNLGNALKQLQRFDEALISFKQALRIDPNYADALNNMGDVLREMQNYDEAMSCLMKAAEINPEQAEILNNIGLVLHTQGKMTEAIASFQKSLQLDPNHARTYNNLGLSLLELGRPEEAIPYFEKSLHLAPDLIEAYNNQGLALRKSGRLAQAAICFNKTIALDKNIAQAHSNLGNLLQDKGLIDEAIASFRTSVRLAPDKPELHSNLLFSLNYASGMNQKQMMAEAAVWWKHHGHASSKEFSHDRKGKSHRRLRIGYVSPDFCQHSVSFFFLPLLKAHDPQKVETFCYGEVINPDEITEEIKKHSDHYRSTVGLRHETLAELIYQDKIDILVDLAGHTGHNRLPIFALRPAPMQLTWLGYPNTTGLQTMDFRLTDAVADPMGEEEGLHSEKLVRLPHGFHCYTPPLEVPDVGELPAALTNRITFGSFNNLLKINRETIKIWSEIMHRLPNSRLMLKSMQLADTETKKYFLEMFAQKGIEEGRIIMLSRTPSIADHLGLYNQMDIGLDPFPYNGTTTTFEALMMGVPVITLRGDRHAGRVGASILTYMDLQELIAEDTEDYIAKAIDLATDRERLTLLRKTLRTRLKYSPFCDSKRFAADMEETYQRLWDEKYSSESNETRLTQEPTAEEIDYLMTLFNQGRYSEGKAFAQRQTKRFPQHGFGWMALGVMLKFQGRPAESLEPMQKAATLLPMAAEAHYNLANTLMDLGRLKEAETSYCRALKIKPDYLDAHCNLGNILMGFGRLEKAEACYRRALEIKPDCLEAHCNLGNALMGLGRLKEAEACFRRALEIKPDCLEAHCNLGNALMGLGRLEEAEACYRRALEIKPDHLEAHCNLGNALNDLGRVGEAETCYRSALEIKPDYAEALSNLSNTLMGLGRLEEAEASCCQALAIKPDFAEAHNNLGNVLTALGRMQEVEACYRRALKIKPDYTVAHYNLGKTLKDLGRLEEAEACFRQTLEIKPDFAEAHNNLGNTLIDLGRPDEAEACFRQALEIKPDFAEALSNLGGYLINQGRRDEGEANCRRALAIKPDCPEAHSNLLSTLNYIATHHLAEDLEEARRYGQMVTGKAKGCFAAWQCMPQPERLRVGLVSGDLRNHPVGYFLENVLTQINSSRIDLIAYPADNKMDELTSRIKPYFSAWKSLAGLSDEASASLIHADGAHLLLDLSGHTAKNRLPIFAWKPAPVQASWLGYSGTTGVPQIDYILGDPYVTPHKEAGHFTEKIWQMPESYLCLTPPDVPVEIGPLPALTAGHITFGCFNNLTKMGDHAVALWSRVLHAIPGSMLFLRTRQLHNSRVLENTIERFAAHGIAATRLILDGTFSSRTELFEAYNRVDIALDPFPYNGTTTSVEGLWMGIPFITRQGNRFHSHVGESIAHNAGLVDWIAENDDDYVAKAVMHTTDLERLATLRTKLRRQVLASPLFDAPRFARHFEATLWGMWERGQIR